jgi:succinate-semialdehyde dehydrogenase/glutarate-semialdehyde dehydrogenase
VDGVSLTGSVPAGSQVGSLAGRQIKKLVLELGGSDPFIVLDDADLDKAAELAVFARNFNAGQSCIAAKRFIILKSVAEEFQERFSNYFRSIKIGDPMNEAVDIGPLAKNEFMDVLEEQLDDAQRKGAHIVYGPEPPRGKGFFFRPAFVAGATPDMKVLSEEVFGPIAPIVVAADEAEIVRLANASEFGLGASIWSRDIERAERIARRIESGFVAINDMVKSDPRLPFGGIKKSGIGRELSHYGLREFVNVKTIIVK